MAQGEELAIEFYPPGDAQGLAESLVGLLQNSHKLQLMATQNFSAALRMTMPNVVQKYLRHFELQQRVQTLRYVSRFRRLPRWMPSKSLLLRLMTRNSLGWARRSAVLHNSWNGGTELQSLYGDGNGRGKLNGSGSAVNGNDVGARIRVGGTAGASGAAARSADNDGRGQNAASHNAEQTPSLNSSDQGDSDQSEARQPSADKQVPSLVVVRARDRRGSDSQNGAGSVGSGNNGSGGE
jgi:hypothetical protein